MKNKLLEPPSVEEAKRVKINHDSTKTHLAGSVDTNEAAVSVRLMPVSICPGVSSVAQPMLSEISAQLMAVIQESDAQRKEDRKTIAQLSDEVQCLRGEITILREEQARSHIEHAQLSQRLLTAVFEMQQQLLGMQTRSSTQVSRASDFMIVPTATAEQSAVNSQPRFFNPLPVGADSVVPVAASSMAVSPAFQVVPEVVMPASGVAPS